MTLGHTLPITPVLSTKEPVDSLIMEDEHLDTIPATESDEVIKSSVENLVQIPIDSYENIEYIEASPLNLEIDSLEEVNDIDQEEKDRLVTNIESLKDNPTPDRVLKSPFSFPIPIVDTASIRKRQESGMYTTHADNSLPEFESFHLDLYDDPSFPRPPPEPPDVKISLIVKTDAPVMNNFDELNGDECFDPGEMRLMLKMTIPSHLSFGLFSRSSTTLRILLYFSPPGVKTPFLTPASPLRAGGLSSG
ncbi:hypothetical protein Tco_0939007 [Tanacetum coccineum]|uniref:Uncharacterized protein n=1 Tax=Tanacetum coccineum TaxID=301880 RepID=A0ABQ5DJN9_9ASTR